jgi:hypothetical protein
MTTQAIVTISGGQQSGKSFVARATVLAAVQAGYSVLHVSPTAQTADWIEKRLGAAGFGPNVRCVSAYQFALKIDELVTDLLVVEDMEEQPPGMLGLLSALQKRLPLMNVLLVRRSE